MECVVGGRDQVWVSSGRGREVSWLCDVLEGDGGMGEHTLHKVLLECVECGDTGVVVLHVCAVRGVQLVLALSEEVHVPVLPLPKSALATIRHS